MHAWMAGQGFPATPRIVGEGLCQLASYRLLRDDSSPRARMLRRNIENDLDPVYGDGFRRVRAAVQRHGQAAVLRSVWATGQLPHGGP
jgi:hypothetical protein